VSPPRRRGLALRLVEPEHAEREPPRGRGRPSQADRVYTELRGRLLRGEVPVGQRLVEEQLAADFATSRTPVREALRRLEGDGHLVRAPSGGLRPSLPNVRSMTQVYDVRLVIEELCVRRAVASGDRAVLESIRDEWITLRDAGGQAARRGPDFVHADERFHRRIAEAAGNDMATRVLRDVNESIRLVRIHDFTTPDRVRATIDEHLEIIDAVLAGDPEAAAAFMRAHVQRSALVVRQRVGAVLARMGEAKD